MKCFNIVLAATLFFALTACKIVGAELATTNGSNVDAVWKELQQAAILPKEPSEWETNQPTDEQAEKFAKQESDAAVLAAEKAENFYKQFPDSTNAITAKELECKMLNTAFEDDFGNTNKLLAWGIAQKTLLTDPKLSDEDRFDLRVKMVRQKALTKMQEASGNRSEKWNAYDAEREKSVRELIEDYPKKDKPYEMLLNIAADSADEKARSTANEVLALPVSENIKIKAEGILRRLNAPGKPLDIKFTALDGTQVDLSQMKGKVVLVDFWATWWPCVGEIPHIKEAYEQFHSKGFEVIGISFDSSWDSGKEALQRFVQKNKMPWPQYFDGQVWKNKFGIQYGIAGIPTMWLVDKKGNLRESNARDDLKGKVEKLLME